MGRIQKMRKQRIRRKKRIRKLIKGTPERPRMTVTRSNKHMYIQVIDDTSGSTMISVNTLQKDHKTLKNRVEDAQILGEKAGDMMKENNISTIVFDRNGYKYHGIVKAIADGARKAGITF